MRLTSNVAFADLHLELYTLDCGLRYLRARLGEFALMGQILPVTDGPVAEQQGETS